MGFRGCHCRGVRGSFHSNKTRRSETVKRGLLREKFRETLEIPTINEILILDMCRHLLSGEELLDGVDVPVIDCSV